MKDLAPKNVVLLPETGSEDMSLGSESSQNLGCCYVQQETAHPPAGSQNEFLEKKFLKRLVQLSGPEQ